MSVVISKGQELSIGSSAWADLRVTDPSLSAQHLQISLMTNECWLRDLKSERGTFVNGLRVTASEIRDGDVIQTGDTTITVRLTTQREVDQGPDESDRKSDPRQSIKDVSPSDSRDRVSSVF